MWKTKRKFQRASEKKVDFLCAMKCTGNKCIFTFCIVCTKSGLVLRVLFVYLNVKTCSKETSIICDRKGKGGKNHPRGVSAPDGKRLRGNLFVFLADASVSWDATCGYSVLCEAAAVLLYIGSVHRMNGGQLRILGYRHYKDIKHWYYLSDRRDGNVFIFHKVF